MSNIKARGFGSDADLREHLADLGEEEAVIGDFVEEPVQADPRREIGWLRKEVADLHERLAVIRETAADAAATPQPEERPWLRIGVTVAATIVLGRLAQRLRLGALGAVAVPLIAARFGSRF